MLLSSPPSLPPLPTYLPAPIQQLGNALYSCEPRSLSPVGAHAGGKREQNVIGGGAASDLRVVDSQDCSSISTFVLTPYTNILLYRHFNAASSLPLSPPSPSSHPHPLYFPCPPPPPLGVPLCDNVRLILN